MFPLFNYATLRILFYRNKTINGESLYRWLLQYYLWWQKIFKQPEYPPKGTLLRKFNISNVINHQAKIKMNSSDLHQFGFMTSIMYYNRRKVHCKIMSDLIIFLKKKHNKIMTTKIQKDKPLRVSHKIYKRQGKDEMI